MFCIRLFFNFLTLRDWSLEEFGFTLDGLILFRFNLEIVTSFWGHGVGFFEDPSSSFSLSIILKKLDSFSFPLFLIPDSDTLEEQGFVVYELCYRFYVYVKECVFVYDI